MKLFYTPIPNMIHKVQVVAIEAGVYDRIERIPTNPFDRDPAHVAANPLGKVPTLLRDDGSPLYGGPAIYEYLDSLHDGPKMFPTHGEARWTALRNLALGDGLFDTAVLRVVELSRPKEYPPGIDRESHGDDEALSRCPRSRGSDVRRFHRGPDFDCLRADLP